MSYSVERVMDTGVAISAATGTALMTSPIQSTMNMSPVTGVITMS